MTSVSAVIPNRDGGSLLERCLAALADARGVDEVVVVDDGSTDGSRESAAARGAHVVDSPRCCLAAVVNAVVARTRNDLGPLLNIDGFVRT